MIGDYYKSMGEWLAFDFHLLRLADDAFCMCGDGARVRLCAERGNAEFEPKDRILEFLLGGAVDLVAHIALKLILEAVAVHVAGRSCPAIFPLRLYFVDLARSFRPSAELRGRC